MPVKSNLPVSQRGECGVAMVEFSLVLPLLALFLFGVMDIGSMLNQYLVLTQVAHEAARLGANTPGLQAGTSCKLGPDVDISTLPTSMLCETPPQTHEAIFQRAELISAHSALTSMYDYRYTVSFQPSAAGTGTTAVDIVSVNIEAKYRAIFPIFGGAPIGVRATAPYMY